MLQFKTDWWIGIINTWYLQQFKTDWWIGCNLFSNNLRLIDGYELSTLHICNNLRLIDGLGVTLYFDPVVVPFHHDWREYVCPGGGPFCHTGGSPQAPPEGEQLPVKNHYIHKIPESPTWIKG